MIECAPEWYYEQDDYQSSCNCANCEKTEKKFEHIADFMSGIVEMLYSTERMDLGRLEDMLEEVCSPLGIKMPATLPTIERKKSELLKFASSLTEYLKQA